MIKIKDKNMMPVEGRFSIVSRNILTGEIIDEYTEMNAVVLDAKRAITRAISGNLLGFVRQIKLGNDTGSGDQYNPEPANDTFDKTTMNVVYTIPGNLQVGYPSQTSVSYSTTIIGAQAVATTGLDTIAYTSAALHTQDGEVFAYKRFPQRSISELIDTSFVWEIGFDL